MLTGAAIVFFTYIGFDSVSTAAEECRNPQRDMPFGIIATLIVCAALYIAVALVLTGIAQLADARTAPRPVADALKALGHEPHSRLGHRGRAGGDDFVAAGFSVRAGAHLVRDVARRPAAEGCSRRCIAKYRTPHVSTWIAGLVVGIPAGIWDIGTFADLSNIGTLFAFIVVSAGVLVLRRTQPERPRGFRVPWCPLLPMLSIVFCLVLMLALPLETWLRFFVWLIDRPGDLSVLRAEAQRAGAGRRGTTRSSSVRCIGGMPGGRRYRELF